MIAIAAASAAIMIKGKVQKALEERRYQLWKKQRTAYIEQVGKEVAQTLVNDLHARAPGLVKADRSWLMETALYNLWERRGYDRVSERYGLVMPGEDRPLFGGPIRERIDDIVRSLPDGPRPALPVLPWTRVPRGPMFGNIDDEVGVCPWPEGGWLGVRGHALVQCAPRTPVREVSKPLDAIELRRGGFLACDPQAEVIAMWQRGWALQPSQTFFYDRKDKTWRTDTHEYRSEDEYGGTALVFDVHRGELVRYGVSYLAVWSLESGWREMPAGLLQLALTGNKTRLLVSDPDLAQTLVLDLWSRQIVRASPRGWAIVATLAWPTDVPDWEQAFPDYSNMSDRLARFRYDPPSKQLLYVASNTVCYTLDLRPALEAAVALDD